MVGQNLILNLKMKFYWNIINNILITEVCLFHTYYKLCWDCILHHVLNIYLQCFAEILSSVSINQARSKKENSKANKRLNL